MSQVLTLNQVKQIRPQLSSVVLAGGVFDILHVGHLSLLKDAKAAGKTLIVHVPSDIRVREKKGPYKPYQPDHERAAILSAIRYVDYVFIADVPHYHKQLIDAILPDVLFFHEGGYTKDVQVYLSDIDCKAEIQVSHRPKLHHTSSIVKKIAESLEPALPL